MLKFVTASLAPAVPAAPVVADMLELLVGNLTALRASAGSLLQQNKEYQQQVGAGQQDVGAGCWRGAEQAVGQQAWGRRGGTERSDAGSMGCQAVRCRSAAAAPANHCPCHTAALAPPVPLWWPCRTAVVPQPRRGGQVCEGQGGAGAGEQRQGGATNWWPAAAATGAAALGAPRLLPAPPRCVSRHVSASPLSLACQAPAIHFTTHALLLPEQVAALLNSKKAKLRELTAQLKEAQARRCTAGGHELHCNMPGACLRGARPGEAAAPCAAGVSGGCCQPAFVQCWPMAHAACSFLDAMQAEVQRLQAGGAGPMEEDADHEGDGGSQGQGAGGSQPRGAARKAAYVVDDESESEEEEDSDEDAYGRDPNIQY